ncbi:Putative pyridoxal phosphate-dependent acyltransferase [Thiorhodovibrio winogradskyi]|uniref:Pyridoxal phosphate-dependent acyltransferase n=1 Tax=Thiorhodovibrio winogradskyi TaxID=77007 RepID=A0ABZ0SGD6_9GAMM|nr:aminotransferase class I/II-fold pyridoxal phosphate-dependent enzyme [Thiorhodovibrio winogradskyi]
MNIEQKRELSRAKRSSLREGEARQGFCLRQDLLKHRKALADLQTSVGHSIFFQASEGTNTNHTVIDGRSFINFSSYNYLGLCSHPGVMAAAQQAIDQYGTSVSASRLASGERPLHRALEGEIARILGTEDALVFVGGFGTNETLIGHLCARGDLILHDSLIHASVLAGARHSGATTRPFPHNQVAALETILSRERHRYRQVLVVIEGVYSMDGDLPDLPAYVRLRERYGCLLMVDEAHSFGVIGANGRGISEHFGVAATDVDLWMGTLSKSLASCGGYAAGPANLMEYLRFSAPGFVYSVGISPPNAAAALAALGVMRDEPWRIARLHERSRQFLVQARLAGLETGSSGDSPIIPVITGDNQRAVRLYRVLYDDGIYALPIFYPVVPKGMSRVRFFLSCLHGEDDIERAVSTARKALDLAAVHF